MSQTTRISHFEIDYDVMVEVGSFSVSLYDTVIEEIEKFLEVRGESPDAVANEPLKRLGMPSTSLPKDVDTSTRVTSFHHSSSFLTTSSISTSSSPLPQIKTPTLTSVRHKFLNAKQVGKYKPLPRCKIFPIS